MQIINFQKAKTYLSRLLEAVMQGEEIIITKAGKPIAKLIPIKPSAPKRRFGVLKGKITIRPDFDASL